MSDTFELEDEPLEPDSELEDEPQDPKSTREPIKPLARLWKAEPDSLELETLPAKKARKGEDTEPVKKSNDSKAAGSTGKTKSAKAKAPLATDENAGKKVLIEETPALDTYETRRRARLIMGSVSVACVLLFVWVLYSVFLRDPVPLTVTSAGGPTDAQPGPGVRSSLDQEARYMYNRAQEFARTDRADQAVAMLNQVIKVYKDTPTAKDSKAALDRAKNHMPLFGDRPMLVAQPEAPKTEPAPTPPPVVVDATPEQPQAAQGEAVLVLPPNAPEVLITPPGALPKAAGTPKASVNGRTLPPGFQANPDAGTDASGWPLVIAGERDTGLMVLVPGGTFKMGNKEGQSSEVPEHQVRLSTYYIDQHEVTNRQFRLFLAESHHRGEPPGKWSTDDKAGTESEKSPVVQVNFQDAEAFATWAGKQIPTEAQWEMAARSTDGRLFPWGNEPAKWERPRTYRQIDEIMTFKEDQSPYGVFDMAGNVLEWTRDRFEYKYYHQFAKTVADNPTGPPSSSRARTPLYSIRGGAKNFSVTARDGVPSDRRSSSLGFRCVLMVEQPSPAPAAGAPVAGQPGGAPPGPPSGAAPKKPAPPPF
jgi:formylglycine-generating enzyme